MAGTTANPLDYCLELALSPGSLFEFSSRFLSPRRTEALAALYALQQAVASIPRSGLDEAVKWAKLKWWGEELGADPESVARHPIVRVLWSSGARERIDRALLQRLVHDAAYQVDAAPPADEAELFERSAAYGATGILLELALADAELDGTRLRHLGAASSVYGLLADAQGNPGLLSRYLPPDLLAAEGYRPDLPAARQERELQSVAGQARTLARGWYEAGRPGLDLGPASADCLHMQLRWALEYRQLSRTGASRVGHFGPSDAWFAWRFCRRLGRG